MDRGLLVVEGLHEKWCMPSAVQTDKLASLKAKQRKAAGSAQIKPFPYVEIGGFVPHWAAVYKQPPKKADEVTYHRFRIACICVCVLSCLRKRKSSVST